MAKANIAELISVKKESRTLDYKIDVNPSDTRHVVELTKDIAAFANTLGGTILVGVQDKPFLAVGLSLERIRTLTPEDLDNKVNSYVEPRIDFAVEPVKNRKKNFVQLLIPKSTSAPHVMKKDGNYPDPAGKGTRNAFSKGTIFVRHSAKSEPITQHDIERIIGERLNSQKHLWLDNVRRVTEAPLGSEVIIQSRKGAVRLTTDPTAPTVRAVLDTTKIRSVDEELTTAVKFWNTDGAALVSEHQLYKFYQERFKLSLDAERAECLIRSSLAHWMPACYWASHADGQELRDILAMVVRNHLYPGDCEALKLVFLISGRYAVDLFDHVISSSPHTSAVNAARRYGTKLGSSLQERQRFLVHIFGCTMAFELGGSRTSASVDKLLSVPQEAARLASQLAEELQIDTHYGNKGTLRRLDLGLYGHRLAGSTQ